MNKKEKKQSKGGAIAIGIIMLLSMIDSFEKGDAASVIVLLGIVLFFVFLAIYTSAKKKKTARPQASAVKTEKKEQKTVSYAQNAEEKKYYQSERKYYDSDCEAMSSSHDHDRRLEQLDGFLKNGLISMKEYNILKNKYGG